MDGWIGGRLDDGQRFRKNTTVNGKEKKGGAGLSRLAQKVRNDWPSRSDEEEEEVWGGSGGDLTNPKFLITAASGLHPSLLLAGSLARSLALWLPPSPRLLLVPAADPTSVVFLIVFLVLLLLLLLLVLYTFLWCSPTELSSAHDLPSNFCITRRDSGQSPHCFCSSEIILLFLLLRNFVVSASQNFFGFCSSSPKRQVPAAGTCCS